MLRSLPALPLQIFAGAAGLTALAFAPPVDGRMLLVPLAGQSADSVTVWATRSGARIVAPGRLPGSLVVQGRAGDIIGTALRHGTLVVAAAPAGCGAAL